MQSDVIERYLRSLPQSQAQYILTIQKGTPFWTPASKPQWEAFLSPAFETLYGGAAGGGKSDLILGLAATQHRSVLCLRRTYPELEDSLIARSQDLYLGQGRYNGGKYIWRLHNGARIRFGHLDTDRSVQEYQSAAFDLIAFDELTQFTRFQYEYLLSRARSTVPGQRVRVLACTNPGGEGNDWVMERWAPWLDQTHKNPAEPGELRWFKRVAGRDTETDADDPDGMSRTYIPARLRDNPYLGDEYRRTLNLLPEPYRSQLLDGDWTAGLEDDAYQVIPTAWIRAAMDRWHTAEQEGEQTAIGVDVARGGDDQTVIATLRGNRFDELHKFAGRTTPDGQSVVDLMLPVLTDGGVCGIDVIGVGASVYDMARSRGFDVTGINFAEHTNATDKSGRLRFANVRAQAYWALREALDPADGHNIALPDDAEILGDLRAPRWKMQTNGIQIESKDDIRKRIGRSTDCGDAVALAWLAANTVTNVRYRPSIYT